MKKLIYSQEYGGPGYLVNYETAARAKDGRLVPILLSAAILYEDGEEVGTVGYFKDLTEVKKLQARLLEQTRLAAMGEAMAEVAHGIKNILYGMKLGAYMVDKALNQGERYRLEKGWQMVRTNMERIARLSLEMLDYARGESRRREAISVNAVVSDVCQALEKRAQEKGIRLELELECDLPFIFGDSEAFHTCVLNLVTNAMEAFGEESVDKRVKVRTFVESGRSLVVEVTDTGRGIAPEVQDSIFRPLFTTKGARGTGLGLAITQKIVQEMGGVVDFHTTVGRGTTFTLRFPLTKSE